MSSRLVLLLGLMLALIGYFGPWVWHPAVVFRYSADDLAEFVKFMPAVRSGQVLITRELFFLPLWLAAIGVALWAGRFVKRRWVSWLVGWLVVYAASWPMPMYPFILDAYKSPEFALSFWTSVAAALLCVLALVFGARLPDRLTAAAWIAIGLIGSTVAPLHFARLKPALEVQHGWTFNIGWGLGAVVIGFVVVATMGVWRLKSLSENVA